MFCDAAFRRILTSFRRNSCGRHSHRSMRRSRSRFSSAYAGYRCTCSTNLWNKNANRSPWYCIHKYGRTPSGCADWRNRCSSFRSSGCAKHSHSWMHRNFGNSFPCDAGCWSILPKSRSYSCDRWSKWFPFYSDRRHSYILDNHFWCRSHRFRNREPMYGCRRKGRSMTHSFRRRDPCRRKCQDFLHNGTYSTHSTPDDLSMYASARRKCLAGNTDCSSDKYRQCRWKHTLR